MSINHIAAVAERFVRVVGWIAGVLVVPLMLTTLYDVFARYLFGVPTLWAYELGAMLTGANFLLGMALVLIMDAHIRVDVVYNRMPPKRQAVVRLLTVGLIVLPVSLLLSAALWHYAQDAIQTGERSGVSAWNPPLWPIRLVFLASFATLAIASLAVLLRDGARVLQPAPESD